ncbi:MAG TPA: FtsX-like permease family protein, partial [Balneolales bacterium]|nr:FtsX-like permease family protein [Balneolales bacterium]
NDAVGKQFNYAGRRGRVIGVTNNFNFESLHQQIVPIVFMIPKTRIYNVAVKIRTGMRDQTLAYLKKKWAYFRPDYPFTYTFVAQNFNKQYTSERRLGNIFGFFALLAVLIASLGLFGLTSFTAQQRIKEIGIRKTLGATVPQIVLLLSKRFTSLVLLSIVLASPVAWYAMNKWLYTFAYRIQIPILTFIWAGTTALVIAWLTIAWQSVKAARMNPVESLRNE